MSRPGAVVALVLAVAACGRPGAAGDAAGNAGRPAATGSPGAAPSPSTVAPQATPPSGGKPVNTAAVYEIRLESPAPGALRATLRNTSGAVQHVLHDAYRQPSSLQLVDAGGRAVEAFDTRTVKKFDATVVREQFTDLGPGREVVLFDEKVTSGDRGKKLRWGPYELTVGARVVWKSAVDTYDDGAGGHLKLGGVWLGSVTSNEVDLRVP